MSAMDSVTEKPQAVSNIIRVKLLKQKKYGLGFLVRKRSKSPHVIVSDLVKTGTADDSGLVQGGDVILKVNDISFEGLGYDKAIEILKALPTGTAVVLVLKGPEGYSSYLETRFNQDGIPKTIRITKPIIHSEGILGRIRRTFSTSATGSSCRTKQTQANCECRKSVAWNTTSDDAKSTLVNGNLQKDNHPPDKSPLIHGSNDHTEKQFPPNEANLNTGIIQSIECSDSNKVANTKDGVVHINHSNVNTILSTGSVKEMLTRADATRSAAAMSVSSCNEMVKDDLITSVKRSATAEPRLGDAVENKRKIISADDSSVFSNGNKLTCTNGTISNNKNCAKIVNDHRENVKELSTSGQGNPKIKMFLHGDAEIESVNGRVNGQSSTTSKITNAAVINDNGEIGHKINDEFSNAKTALELYANNKGSPAKRFVKVRNVGEERPVTTDNLHQKAMEPLPCSAKFCMGSVMDVGLVGSEPRSKPEVLVHAKDFINQYYQSIKRYNTPAHLNRWNEVEKTITETGTYELTTPELTYGAKTSWRNAPRCIGRIQWSKLQVFDARHITTVRGMFEAICNHIKYGTNKGNIRSAITVFPARTDGKHDFRVWNPQFIRYAGYKQEDGSIIGDPANVDLTQICQKLGWKGKGTRFDVMPLVLQANGHDPEMFEIPSDLVLEVHLIHPKFPWFAEMGLQWYALPAVACLVFDCGGLIFPAAPFNGWYMGTEVGARDLCDPYRYNLLEDIAKRIGFDTRKSSSLWKDRTLVEINVAVLYSYQSQGVTITDHHAAAESFMKHLDNEQKLRGGCPADWVWVVPPISGSILPVFHQEMLMYKLKPSLEYQLDPWKTHVWKKDKERTRSTTDRPRRKIGFRELARAVKFSAKLMGKALARRVKCVILFGTETGRSEGFAKTLCQIFKHAFDAKVMCMSDYDVGELEHEALVLVVTSTFGNGDPPENGEEFARLIFDAKHPDTKDMLNRQTSYLRMSSASAEYEDADSPFGDKDIDNQECSLQIEDNLTMETGPLSNVRYSVFGLGSSAYPNFCAFAHYVDNIFHDLGGERIYKTMEGDELCGQEESFRTWAKDVFKAACDTFCTGDDRTMQDATGTLSTTDHSWKPDTFRVTPAVGEKKTDIIAALSATHNKNVIPCRFIERTQLQSEDSDRQTILIKLDTTLGSSELLYQPGDHVAIYAGNSPQLVDAILIRLHNAPLPDQIIQIEVMNERATPLGTMTSWDQYKKIPSCSLKTAFSRLLDITTPPRQSLLKIFATQATKDCDRESLENLANDSHLYEEWKYETYPNIVQVLDQFPSLRIPPSLLLTQLPLLTARYYSISSSLKHYPGEIHATVAVVKYRTQGSNGPLHEGVCSTWLNRLEEGDTIPCIVRHAPAFHMPVDTTLPIIIVGPGTGIAPFRSFWQQRKIDMEMLPEPQRGTRQGWGTIHLYFGCRNSKVDDIYKNELIQMKNECVLRDVHTAHSREPDTPKTYVQAILKKNATQVFKCIVMQGGHFYVCGDVKMASDVTATLEEILVTEGDMTMQDSKYFVLKLRDSDRFHEDIFGVTSHSSEVTDRARDQAKKAWNYINSASKSRLNTDKETVAPIPSGEMKAPKGKPKAPRKPMYTSETTA